MDDIDVDVVQYLQSKNLIVNRAGSNNVSLPCFFHGGNPNDKGHLYISIDPESAGVHYCHVCQIKGNMLTLMRHFGDQPTAKMELDDRGRQILEEATSFYESQMTAEGFGYLRNRRGLMPTTIAKHRWGWAEGGVTLTNHLLSKGYSYAEIIKTGVITDVGGHVHDFFEGELVFAYQVAGTVVLLRGKKIDGKYRTPGGAVSRLFNTDGVLQADEVILCEGEADAMVAEQFGYVAIGVPGAKMWKTNWTDYFTDVKRVWVCYDNDAIGKEGAAEVLKILGQKAKRVDLPNAGDLSDWYMDTQAGRDDFADLLKQALERSTLLVTSAQAMVSWESLKDVGGLKLGIAPLDAAIAPGMLPGQIMVTLARTGVGKQAPVDEPILTPSGWVKMGEIRPGDEVIGSDGKPTFVLSVHPQGIKPVMRVTFSDGSWTRCGPEHLWTTRSKGDKYHGKDWKVLPTSALTPGWHIPITAPIHHVDVPLPVDPYMLGVLLGDGSIGCPHLSASTDRWIAERLGWDLPPHKTSSYTVEGPISDPALRYSLQSLGLWGKRSWEKHLPPIYLLGSPSDRLSVLRGLLDTDGHALPTGGVEFSSTSEALTDAVVQLTQSLGGVARKNGPRITHYTHNGERRDGRPSWRVNVKLNAHTCPFLLPRKADAWVPPDKYDCARIIRSVVEDGPPVEQVCIKVSNNDGLYVTRDYIVTHNTISALNILHRAMLLQPDMKILLFSLEQTAAEWFERAMRIWNFYNLTCPPEEVAIRASEWWSDHIMLVVKNRVSLDEMVSSIGEYRERMGLDPDLVVVDYLGYFARSFKGEAYERTSEAIMEIKAVAKDLAVKMFIPHQLSRKGEFGVEPHLDDGRDSGVIEETADFGVTIWSEDSAPNKNAADHTGIINIRLAKSRHGSGGLLIPLQFGKLTLSLVPAADSMAQLCRDELRYRLQGNVTWQEAIQRHRLGHPQFTGGYRPTRPSLGIGGGVS